MPRIRSILVGVLIAVSTGSWMLGAIELAANFGAATMIAIAIALRGSERYATFSYTFTIFAAVIVALQYPQWFLAIGEFQTTSLIVPLLMIIMFGMGASLSFLDFAAVFKTPRNVLIGLLCQYSMMPLIGFTLATLTHFPPEIAAGIILVGCAPGGLASNVMAFIAKANLALSLSLTAVSTLLAPFITPYLMGLFAGELVAIDLLAMFWSISKMVLLPIMAGLLFNHFFHGRAVWFDRFMPLISMAGIAIIIAIITAAGRDSLLTIGGLLIVVVLVHNALGYTIGYGVGRIAGMDQASARTLAFEVGMQNSGLASGIAVEMGRVATMGLAPAVFGPLMNITGSSLAAWFRNRPLNNEKASD
ncbi:bile acid:sodium symporter family protein [Alteromonas sp. ASW11-36]|uniref:Bile acid:sodium symporter family protein n=1 Tax=Alteromonas arenosi TaxID=3055817 RepID=A0ABT7SSS0_9ALTE|nr:bile acid:sodium symporter family protein [Alteromonas sp. ASW11-36]MDM7859215.1 bile acid:sodium symporter family protein [Alteromonas sp. ASW11-36]